MKKHDHEWWLNLQDMLVSCTYFFILFGSIVFTVFVWLSCHHIEEILEFLKNKTW